MSRRLRLARQKKAAKTVVIQVPMAITQEAAAQIKTAARRGIPGRNVLVISGGATVAEV